MRTRRIAATLSLLFGALLIIGVHASRLAEAAGPPPTLFDRIGIGADWGPHWATGARPQDADPRDTQADGAFPAEICLLRNAGFKTIRMYDENVTTWLAVLDAVDAVNNGTLNCNPAGGPAADCKTSGSCMSVVYQVAICGPDPRSLAWNGTYAQIDQVKCYEVGKTVTQEAHFKDSVDAELLKLTQIGTNAGDKFAANVSLVLAGNEVLYSRGVCSNGGAACTDSRDCGTGGTCDIGHYCSNQLAGSVPPATCSSSAGCGHGASCTDVTNLDPLKYAFGRVWTALSGLSGSAPPISISLQMDLLVSPSFGDDPKTAPLMWSRQQLGQALPNRIIATNTYPDQWGRVTVSQIPTACTGGSLASCVGPANAVLGQALLAGCVDDPRYRDPVTGKIAHTIDDYFTRLRSYYPGFDLMIAETGWHTSGTCVAYNDCTSTYSAADAAIYYRDLYTYVQQNRIPLLVFQAFDQRTKQCDPAGRGPDAVAEANYGVFTNFCQLKGGNQALLPPAGPGSSGPNLSAFNALLDNDPGLGGKSCRLQTLVEVTGTGSTGVCEHATGIACLTGYDPNNPAPGNDKCPPGPGGATNRCVFGYCASAPDVGCNPGDPANVVGCGECKRAGNCFSLNPPPGLFVATTGCAGATCIAACRSNQTCDGARAPFTTSGTCGDGTNDCGCFVAMAPATEPAGGDNPAMEAPGFNLSYSNGAFQFRKDRTLLPEVVPHASGFEVTPVWGNVFLGRGWTLGVVNPPGTTVSKPGACPVNTVSALDVTNPLQPSLTWAGNWAACSYQVGGVNASNPTRIVFPRGYLTEIPRWPRTVPCLAATGVGASDCGGGPEPIAIGFEGTSGRADNVGVVKDSGKAQLSGRFRTASAPRLDLASLTIEQLLNEVDGVGELSRRPGGSALLPIFLTARAGGRPTAAIYQTASGVRPIVKVEIKSRDVKTGLMEFSIAVDRDSMPVRPARCAGSPSRTELRTSFTLDDGSGQPLLVTATLPWQCRGTELRLP